jgi:hypothetical protein
MYTFLYIVRFGFLHVPNKKGGGVDIHAQLFNDDIAEIPNSHINIWLASSLVKCLSAVQVCPPDVMGYTLCAIRVIATVSLSC